MILDEKRRRLKDVRGSSIALMVIKRPRYKSSKVRKKMRARYSVRERRVFKELLQHDANREQCESCLFDTDTRRDDGDTIADIQYGSYILVKPSNYIHKPPLSYQVNDKELRPNIEVRCS
jgi:hypothetical protein